MSDAGKMVAEPCEMGAMCLNCQPRGPNGECPDAPQPAKPAEQEPVAWMCSNKELMHKGYQMFSATGGGDWNIPVYTAPQPHKQPLTREEIFELAEPFGEFKYGDAQGHKRIDFANAIIAAYERKNGVQT